jgi:hypothetical protein
MQQFEEFRASTLYCKKCAKAMPVRERLLLVLPGREIYDYLCSGCSESLGKREVTEGEKALAQQSRSAGMRRRARPPGGLI